MFKKILIGLVSLIVLFIVALVSIPFIFKDQINAKIKEEINAQVKAKVDYAGYDLSLIRSFPSLSFGMSGFTITGIDDFKGDTLVSIGDFRFAIDIMSVINKQKYKIQEISLLQPHIHAIVNKSGHSNWDIARSTGSSSSSSSSNFALEIKKYQIENGYITYDDQQGGTYLSVGDLNFSGSGDVTQDLYKLSTKTRIASLTAKSGAVSYLSSAKLEAHNDIDVDQKNSKYSFKENEINLNDLGLVFDGFIQMNKNDMAMDIAFKSQKTEFKSILSLIPAIFKKDFDKIKTSGSLALNGKVKGTYDAKTTPAIDLNLKVENAMFQYPSLPTAVTNINVTANINKTQGSNDLTVVDIPKLHLDIANDSIDAAIHVTTPVSDPNVTAKINGKLDLASVPKLYPMQDLEKISGLLVAVLDFKGRMSDIDKKNYTAIQAAGNVKVTNMVYDTKQTPMAINVRDLGLTFNPKNVSLDNFDAVIGKSDFSASGMLNNFVGYLFSKGTLAGSLNLKCNQFNANEWLSKDDKPQSTSPTQYFQVPKNISFTANSSFGKILYDKMVLTNVHGTVNINDESIHLQDLFAELLGGSATINALYSTKDTKTPKVTFSYDIKTLDMQQTYTAVGMSQKIAPVMKYLQGNYSTDLTGSGTLKQDMSVDYSTLQGSGKVQIPSARVVGLPILQKIAEVTKVKALDNLAINNAWTVLKFNNGRVAVDPTDIKFGNGYLINMKGSNGFDETIDYDVRFDVPSKELGGTATELMNKIPKIPGIDMKMPETLNVFLKIGGTVTKPTVSITKVAGNGTSAGDMVKDAAKQAADKAKQAAEQAAKDAINNAAKEGAAKAAQDAAQKLKDAAKGFKLPF